MRKISFLMILLVVMAGCHYYYESPVEIQRLAQDEWDRLVPTRPAAVAPQALRPMILADHKPPRFFSEPPGKPGIYLYSTNK